jgi:hypothetical protein
MRSFVEFGIIGRRLGCDLARLLILILPFFIYRRLRSRIEPRNMFYFWNPPLAMAHHRLS